MTENNTRARGRRRAIIAGAAGVALLIGGSTYALWSRTADQTGGAISSGDLKVAAMADGVKAYDVSADRKDSQPGATGAVDVVLTTPVATSEAVKSKSGHAITLGDDNWKIVPGDMAAITFPYTITLVGDNLVADLSMSAKDSGDAALVPTTTPGITYTYGVYDKATGVPFKGFETPVPFSTNKVATFASADLAAQIGGGLKDNADTATPVIGVGDAGTLDVTVVLYAKFTVGSDTNADVETHQADPDTAALTDKVVALATTMTAELDQTRGDNVGQFVDQP